MRKKLLHIVLWVFLSYLPSGLKAQTLIPPSRVQEQKLENEYYKRDLPLLPLIHGYYKEDFQPAFSVDSVLYPIYKTHLSWFGRKMWNESFILVDSSDYNLTVDPLFNLQVGKDNLGKRLITNTRGAQVMGKLGPKFSFGSWFYENQAFFPACWDTVINSTRVVPGQGRAKRYQEKGWDYAYSGAFISWRALKNLNLEFGRSKNFIGNGYRSMILSDISSNYPYLRIDWTHKNFHYVKLFASFTNLFYPSNDVREFYKKTGTLQMLSYNLGKKLQISIFDMNLWNNPDSSGKFTLKPGMMNPFPILSSLVGRDQEENIHSINGLNITYKIIPGMLCYGQIIWEKKTASAGKDLSRGLAYQLGWKYYDMFGIPNLFTLLELNQAQPYTYSHPAANLAASNYQQPLAHPLGANFREGVWLLNYRYKRVSLDSKMTSARYGADPNNENWGKNILISDATSSRSSGTQQTKLFQGTSTQLTTLNLEAAYTLNFHTQMSWVLGCYLRNETSTLRTNKTSLIYFAFRTNLMNLYYDY